ncbi:serine/threonine protein kinase [Candidatus Venteria ishoeyi]|uniref:Serine/threonine-protein kinase PknB n=1 Tax=Candidatus Venteria ishoeyi TaxID=1899563 RepID=A0A1H6F3Z1_9GAMM|nr:serine/threonine-protein kinase [Candidatus Venteria ishoeyi]SEH04867.1 Serine/threonine-protein kinase PknB [Candidatus Venteria ishoeyi]
MSSASESTNILPIGYRFKHYQIKKLLGHGGFGITYLASDLRLNKLVAIKEYFPHDFAIREKNIIQPKTEKDHQAFSWGKQRFKAEAQILSQFHHPNIVQVLEFFELNGSGYIVMAYESGQSLVDALNDGETATYTELKILAPPLLDGLATIHQANLLHRDIKPANIYLRDKDNSPVLLDFGSARYDVSSHSRPVTSIVSRGYAPYEQYTSDGSQQGAWTDIYAMAGVFYTVMTGQVPVDAPTRVGAINNNKPDVLKPVSELCKDSFPEKFLNGIDWALEVLEPDRPQDVASWTEALLSGSLSNQYHAAQQAKTGQNRRAGAETGKSDIPVIISNTYSQQIDKVDAKAPYHQASVVVLASLIFIFTSVLAWLLLT